MYVCVCNAVTEDDVRGCMAGGACTPKEVRAACGMKPGCGSCTKRLYAMVSEHRTASELVDAITGGPASPVMPAERTEPLPLAEPAVRPADPARPADPIRAERGSAPPTAA
jgi:bacterioferritin-associated ferredoxin